MKNLTTILEYDKNLSQFRFCQSVWLRFLARNVFKKTLVSSFTRGWETNRSVVTGLTNRCQFLGRKDYEGYPTKYDSSFFPQGFVVFEALKVPAIASYVQHVSCTYYLSRRLSSKSIW